MTEMVTSPMKEAALKRVSVAKGFACRACCWGLRWSSTRSQLRGTARKKLMKAKR